MTSGWLDLKTTEHSKKQLSHSVGPFPLWPWQKLHLYLCVVALIFESAGSLWRLHGRLSPAASTEMLSWVALQAAIYRPVTMSPQHSIIVAGHGIAYDSDAAWTLYIFNVVPPHSSQHRVPRAGLPFIATTVEQQSRVTGNTYLLIFWSPDIMIKYSRVLQDDSYIHYFHVSFVGGKWSAVETDGRRDISKGYAASRPAIVFCRFIFV